jgi:biopolymer transport protein ExbD
MAYRPSRRRTRERIEQTEPDMTPIMNLMVVLIPLLLSSAQLIKIGVIDLNLPPATTEAAAANAAPEKQVRLELAITITDKGFYLSSNSAVLQDKKDGPSIPKNGDSFDFETLTKRLYEIKKKAEGHFDDADAIVIQAEPDIDYQTLVTTMDASRSIMVEGEERLLFPNVSVSAVVL